MAEGTYLLITLLALLAQLCIACLVVGAWTLREAIRCLLVVRRLSEIVRLGQNGSETARCSAIREMARQDFTLSGALKDAVPETPEEVPPEETDQEPSGGFEVKTRFG